MYLALVAGAGFIVVLCCDLLLAGERAMAEQESNSITDIVDERLR